MASCSYKHGITDAGDEILPVAAHNFMPELSHIKEMRCC